MTNYLDYLDKPIKEKPLIINCPNCGKILKSRDKRYWDCPRCNRTFMKNIEG